jgi:hypothetical protein
MLSRAATLTNTKDGNVGALRQKSFRPGSSKASVILPRSKKKKKERPKKTGLSGESWGLNERRLSFFACSLPHLAAHPRRLVEEARVTREGLESQLREKEAELQQTSEASAGAGGS